MKIGILIIALILSATTTYSQTDSICPLTMSVKLEKTYQVKYQNTKLLKKRYAYKGDSLSQTLYDIQISLNNISKKPVFFWLMSCSWWDNFLVNNNYISFEYLGCDSNFPDLIEIKPGETKTLSVTASKSLKFDYDKNLGNWPQVPTTKLGLITIANLYEPTQGNVFGYSLSMEDKSSWKIIWSNPLYLLSGKEARPDPITFDVKQ
jgi:hypothetical protein